jgi:Type I phosphodiesterase / nucleotide pyrophosphatase
MRPRLVLLVLDGFCPRHCTGTISPHLVSMQSTGAYAPQGGRSVLPSSTYPNHASIVTGLEPVQHGIFANSTFTNEGIEPAQRVGARGVTFLDAARENGLVTGVAVGDHNLIGVIGAERANHHWPPRGETPAGTPLVRGYAQNATTFRELTTILRAGADVALCQLDNTDGISHLFGPDSPEAIEAHSAGDQLVGELVEVLQSDGRWHETVLCVISDHSQIAPIPGAPAIDLPGGLLELACTSEVIEEGSAALVRFTDQTQCEAAMRAVEGVAEVGRFTDGILYAYATPGRGFSSRKPLSRGIHGGPETSGTICMAVGGHPGLSLLKTTFSTVVPTSATIATFLLDAVRIPWVRGRSA